MKICLTCAAGGHLDELLTLLETFKGHEYFFVTVPQETTKNLPKIAKTYYVRNRPKPINSWRIIDVFLLTLYYFYLLLPCMKILLKERPIVIIGFGGEATLHLSYLGKLIGAKVVYIESLARVHTLSGTGRLVYLIADLFLVQWRYLLKKYKKAKYWGKII